MDERKNNNGSTPEEPEAYPLDDAAIESIAELDAQERNVSVARSAILSYFLRAHKLKGDWSLAPNRRELIKRQRIEPAAVGIAPAAGPAPDGAGR